MKYGKLVGLLTLVTFPLVGCGGTSETSYTYVDVVTKQPTCEAEGVLTHVCNEDSAKTYTEAIPALGHDFDVEHIKWTWAEDYSSCVSTVTCVRCDKAQSNNATVTSEVISEPTFEVPGETKYTATSNIEGKDYTDVQDVETYLSHVWVKDEEKSYDASYVTEGLLAEYDQNFPTVTRETPLPAQKDDEEFVVSEANPYLIANVADWEAFATKAGGDKCQGEFYKLTADLGSETSPITTFVNNTVDSTAGINTMFAGSFDGNNHSMTVDLTRANGRSGLFAFVTTGGVVKNMSLYGNVASPSGKTHAGAFVADMRGGTLSNLTNYANVTATQYVGGIVAFVNTGNANVIENCANYGNISATSETASALAGGIAGGVEKGTTISSCANYGNVTGVRDRVGGIAGQLKISAIVVENCTNGYETLPEGKTQPVISADMTATTGKFVGGIVGSTEIEDCEITGCTNYATVKGNNGVSGILGLANKNTTLTDNTNAGNVTGVANTGGIVGRVAGSKVVTLSGNTNTGTVKIGEVVATEEVGGTASTNTTPGTIVGSNGGTIQ